MCQEWMSHVTHMKESCRTYECVKSHTHIHTHTHTHTHTQMHTSNDIETTHTHTHMHTHQQRHKNRQRGDHSAKMLRGLHCARLHTLTTHIHTQIHTQKHTYTYTERSPYSFFHDALMNESCDTWAWVMSHIWMRQVTCRNESCRTNAWVIESSHACERVDLFLGMIHVTYMIESSHM